MLSLICICLVWSLLSPLCPLYRANPAPVPCICTSSVMYFMWCLFTTPPSVNKLFLLSRHLHRLCSFLWAFLPSVISCYNRHIHFSHLIIPSRPTPCSTHCYIHHTNQLSPPLSIICLWTVIPVTFSFFPLLPLSATRCSAPQMDMQFWVRECVPCRILNPKPTQTFLPRRNLFISQSPLSPQLQAVFAHLTSPLTAIWLCWQQLPHDRRVAITLCNMLFLSVRP